MKYRKALKVFQKYTIKMEVTGWDEKSFKMLHTFIVGKRVVAEGTSCGVILSKTGVIPPEEVMKKIASRLNEYNL
jgi:acyl-CoA thioesterase FadM